MHESSAQNRPVTRGQWSRGTSGNPGGRPRGFGTLIREETEDGLELVELALKIMRGQMTVTKQNAETGFKVDEVPSIKERFEALKWLADRGWGKAVESIKVEDGGLGPLSGQSIDDLIVLARLES